MAAGDHQRRFLTFTEALAFYEERDSPATADGVVKQYELLRTEIVASLAIQIQILSFGTATLGLVAGAAFVGPPGSSRGHVLVLFLPLLAYLTITIWFSEVMRMLRAGAFLLTLEKKLDCLNDGSLVWEANVLRGRLKYRMWKPYYGVLDPDQLRLLSVTLLFFALATSSIALGWSDVSWVERSLAVVAAASAVVVILVLYHLRVDQLADILSVEERPILSRALGWVGRRGQPAESRQSATKSA
jgi:hypothetical protein